MYRIFISSVQTEFADERRLLKDYIEKSVQVELFPDRLEIYNPGTINPALPREKLAKRHGSFPNNPLMAEPLYLTRYIERLGTGLTDLIEHCREAGLKDPVFHNAYEKHVQETDDNPRARLRRCGAGWDGRGVDGYYPLRGVKSEKS